MSDDDPILLYASAKDIARKATTPVYASLWPRGRREALESLVLNAISEYALFCLNHKKTTKDESLKRLKDAIDNVDKIHDDAPLLTWRVYKDKQVSNEEIEDIQKFWHAYNNWLFDQMADAIRDAKVEIEVMVDRDE